MFRDNKFANRMKNEAEEKDRQERLRLERLRLERERQEAARRQRLASMGNRRTFPVDDEEDTRLLKAMQPSLFSRLFGNRASQPENFFSYHERQARRTKILMVLGVIAVVGFVAALAVYNFEYGLREGYVTGREYQAGYWSSSTSCDSHGHCTSTSHYHPPQWFVEITYDDASSSWGVSEDVYEELHHGEWFCVGGISYRCQGEPPRGVTHPRPEHFTVAGQQDGL